MIWDKLPEDIQKIIYSKVLYTQPKYLLEDLVSYVKTINYIEYYHSLVILTYWDILWNIVLLFYNKNNKEKTDHFNDMQDFVLNNSNLMIRYEGAMYWIKKYVTKLSIFERESLIYNLEK